SRLQPLRTQPHSARRIGDRSVARDALCERRIGGFRHRCRGERRAASARGATPRRPGSPTGAAMRVELLGYVSRWRIDGDGCHGHVTTHEECDLHLWSLAAVAEPYCHRAQWLRLRGLTIGTWFIAT